MFIKTNLAFNLPGRDKFQCPNAFGCILYIMYDVLLNVIWLGNTSTFEGIHKLGRQAMEEGGHPNVNDSYEVNLSTKGGRGTKILKIIST